MVIVQTGFGAESASCSVGTRILAQGQGGRGVKLTTHLRLVPRLRMSGAMPLFPLHAFMARTEVILSFTLCEIIFWPTITVNPQISKICQEYKLNYLIIHTPHVLVRSCDTSCTNFPEDPTKSRCCISLVSGEWNICTFGLNVFLMSLDYDTALVSTRVLINS